MSGIRVVIHLVRCTQSLLICDDLNTEHLRFHDAAQCEAQLPKLIEAATRQGPPASVVMGRCRFIPEPYVPPTNGLAAPPSG
jgi:hypothetical protein